MIRRTLLHLLNLLARRQDRRIVRVDDLLTMAAKDSRLRVDRAGAIGYEPGKFALIGKRMGWANPTALTDEEYARRLGEFYLHGSDG